MDQLEEIFGELGISQYLEAFVDNGFDSWDTILDITESDLDALGVKLGHRRKLQRRIANYRGQAATIELLVSPTCTSIEEPSANAAKSILPNVKEGKVTVSTAKRKYRRHPKPDENAPERPPSAYVLFSNKMREDLKGQNLTFTEIAKLVGENWQNLDRAEKEPYETQAQEAKERYNREMNDYKKTAEYKQYGDYLQDFRKRQALQEKDGSKRIKTVVDSLHRGSSTSVGSLGLSGTASSAGSGSESQPGSEPPPTRHQRMGSITCQPDVHISPAVPLAFQFLPEETTRRSPRPQSYDDTTVSRSRGLSSPNTREYSARRSRRHSGFVDGHQRRTSEAPTSFNTPILSNLNDPRIPPPISQSPDSVASQNTTPSLSYTSTLSSGPSTTSSNFWAGPPSLRTEQSSSGSTSSHSSYPLPKTPSETSLPIHALLSPKPEVPPRPSEAPLLIQPPTSIHQHPGRPPGQQFHDGRPAFNNTNYAPGPANQLPPVAPVVPMQSPTEVFGNQAILISPTSNSSGESALDGMSALLRASDIVGRQNH